jgi:serine/threonine-protein kinase
MHTDPTPDETAPHGLDEGRALVNRARDTGAWEPVIGWLAKNPALAEPLARYIRFDRLMERAVSPPQPAARVGTVLGDFELLEEIGRGAMGAVYRARQLSPDRLVAVKVVPVAGLSAVELARARFEAEAMSRLSHPNVVPLYHFGETDTELYFAMPLLTGGSLAAWVKGAGPDRSLKPARAAEIVRDIALGVHHAHRAGGLIHRDLKPANVLLDANGRPHVADFGLARRADATASGAAGSPAYMAPEQARGEKHLTPAADVWALGVILFELLTGRTPFGGGTFRRCCAA